MNLVDELGKLQVVGKDFVVEINKETGIILSYKYQNLEFIKDEFGLRPNFWRAPLDNDYGAGMPKKLEVWKNASYDKLNVQNLEIKNEISEPLKIKLTYNFEEANATWDLEYTIYNNGIIKVNNNFDARKSSLPYLFRLGMRMQMPAEFVDVEYYGRGLGLTIVIEKLQLLLENILQKFRNLTKNMFCTRNWTSYRYALVGNL